MTSASPHPRILIVDDEPQIRGVVRAILETAHYEIDDCDDGSRALDKMAAWKPDLVITLGAGSIGSLAGALVDELQRRHR
mgnify:CR=1 FL=1